MFSAKNAFGADLAIAPVLGIDAVKRRRISRSIAPRHGTYIVQALPAFPIN